ncbi:hypothetical protein, partial [Tateyamaria sp.]|uniref:hypothetical protein n=1 Tax=Tateyamaria sp. TaxID=1929288 RepID=UPI00329B8D44
SFEPTAANDSTLQMIFAATARLVIGHVCFGQLKAVLRRILVTVCCLAVSCRSRLENLRFGSQQPLSPTADVPKKLAKVRVAGLSRLMLVQ